MYKHILALLDSALSLTLCGCNPNQMVFFTTLRKQTCQIQSTKHFYSYLFVFVYSACVSYANLVTILGLQEEPVSSTSTLKYTFCVLSALLQLHHELVPSPELPWHESPNSKLVREYYTNSILPLVFAMLPYLVVHAHVTCSLLTLYALMSGHAVPSS